MSFFFCKGLICSHESLMSRDGGASPYPSTGPWQLAHPLMPFWSSSEKAYGLVWCGVVSFVCPCSSSDTRAAVRETPLRGPLHSHLLFLLGGSACTSPEDPRAWAILVSGLELPLERRVAVERVWCPPDIRYLRDNYTRMRGVCCFEVTKPQSFITHVQSLCFFEWCAQPMVWHVFFFFLSWAWTEPLTVPFTALCIPALSLWQREQLRTLEEELPTPTPHHKTHSCTCHPSHSYSGRVLHPSCLVSLPRTLCPEFLSVCNGGGVQGFGVQHVDPTALANNPQAFTPL